MTSKLSKNNSDKECEKYLRKYIELKLEKKDRNPILWILGILFLIWVFSAIFASVNIKPDSKPNQTKKYPPVYDDTDRGSQGGEGSPYEW